MVASFAEVRYRKADCVVFRKTAAAFGGLSNMASGFPLRVHGVRVNTAEALYQACRFPLLPAVQRQIIEQASPMAAKMKSKPHRSQSRPDWETVNVAVMAWCLRLKLAQNWSEFGRLLRATKARPIVEESHRDRFWGAVPGDAETLVGRNVLGQLLVELRQQLLGPDAESLRTVTPPDLPNFLLFEQPIGVFTPSTANR
jgi:type I restriction enzyme, S subunit